MAFQAGPPVMHPISASETEASSSGDPELPEIARKPPRTFREKADPRCFGDGTTEWGNCHQRWHSYEESCQQHLRDIEMSMVHVRGEKPGENLEEAVCLNMHLTSQRDHLYRLLCEVRDLLAVSLMHYRTEQQTTGGPSSTGTRTSRNSTTSGTTQRGGS